MPTDGVYQICDNLYTCKQYMAEKIKHLAKQIWPYITQLQDIRYAGLVLFGIIVLMISWSGVKTIQTNYELQKQIATLQQQNDVRSLDNKNLKLQNDYYRTDQYLELSARQNFGLAAPGEKEIIVPKDVALAHVAPVPSSPEPAVADKNSSPFFERNFKAWIDFFLHHPQQDN